MKKLIILVVSLINLTIVYNAHGQISLNSNLFNTDGTYFSPVLSEDRNGKLSIENFSIFYCADKNGKIISNCLNG